jgi:hypothetical protein
MSALSDYLESGLLHHIFRGQSFPKPSEIAIALTSGVPLDSHTGATIPELPSGLNNSLTGYSRISLGAPSASGDSTWLYNLADHNVGSGLIKNAGAFLFNTALLDWGWVSGIAILDSATYGSGNLLLHSTLDNPRIIYMGDTVKFDASTLQIRFK